MEQIDAKQFGLTSRTIIEKKDENEFVIVKLRKSRIIMKDALKILDETKKIKAILPKAEVSLRCYDNICSKSTEFLNAEGIKIEKSS